MQIYRGVAQPGQSARFGSERFPRFESLYPDQFYHLGEELIFPNDKYHEETFMEKKCTKCAVVKPLSDYCKSAKGKLGVQPACKLCMNIAYNVSRKKKQKHYQSVQYARNKVTAKRLMDWKASKGCKSCGENDPVCLDLHHLDPSIKENDVSNLLTYGWETIMIEAAKCIVVCSNCHRKIHAGSIVL